MEAVDQNAFAKLYSIRKMAGFLLLAICFVVATGIFRGEPVYQMF